MDGHGHLVLAETAVWRVTVIDKQQPAKRLERPRHKSRTYTREMFDASGR